MSFLKVIKGNKPDDKSTAKVSVKETPSTQTGPKSEEPVYQDMPQIQEGKVSFHSLRLLPANDGLMVSFFVSNGLDKKINFENFPLTLLNANSRVLARQMFDPDVVGDVSPGTDKPCVVKFLLENTFVHDYPEQCRLVLGLIPDPAPVPKIQFQSLPEDTTETKRKELEQILDSLPPMNDGELNISRLQAVITSEGELHTTLILRSTSDRELSLQQIALAVFDGKQQELARGRFTIEDLIIQPYKAVLWTFNFGVLAQGTEVDLTGWHVDFIEQK